MKQTQQTQPKVKALLSGQAREGVRKWLAGANRKSLPGRASLGKDGAPKTYKATIMAILGAPNLERRVENPQGGEAGREGGGAGRQGGVTSRSAAKQHRSGARR